MNPEIIFLVGPTAIGKTEIGVILAKKNNAEIISCDSMQVYRRMDIITSKPPAALRKKIAHHLFDIVAPAKEYNVSKYRKEALRKIKEVIKKGKVPLLVGGSGLYMSILIDGIFKAKSQNKNIRNRLYEEGRRLGNAYLYNKLKEADPEAARRVHPNDTRRIVRALEVFEVTGQAISKLQKQRKGLADEYDIKIFCFDMERQKLYRRIEARVDKMFKQGLIAEMKKLLKLKLSRTASCAIGVKELKGYFAGRYDLEEAKRLMKRNSRLYAKRQLTWFRKDKRIEWVKISGQEKPERIAGRISGMIKAG